MQELISLSSHNHVTLLSHHQGSILIPAIFSANVVFPAPIIPLHDNDSDDDDDHDDDHGLKEVI